MFYFPYWRIDAELDGQLSGTGTSLRIWRVGEIEYTEHKQFAVSRRGKMRINELIKNALIQECPTKNGYRGPAFPMDKAVDFRSQYLAGFQAEKTRH